MVDATALLKAMRLGYDIIQDDQKCLWCVKGGYKEGPFMSMDSASYAALDHHTLREHIIKEILSEQEEKNTTKGQEGTKCLS